MGRQFLEYIATERVFACQNCKSHLSSPSEIISKAFQGASGRAYLFAKVVNICEGTPEDRLMTTGLHTVMDVKCITCKNVLGWKYQKAHEESQRYKEGKVILEKSNIIEVCATEGGLIKSTY